MEQTEMIRAATNAPELAQVVVELGDKKFPILDLAYDDYVVFMAKVTPLLAAIGSQVPVLRNLGMTHTESFDANTLMKYCGKDLPELACIVCRQSDPDITADEVKRLGKTPFKLAALVLRQIEQNKMITDIADFFVQTVVPVMAATKPKTKLTTVETH